MLVINASKKYSVRKYILQFELGHLNLAKTIKREKRLIETLGLPKKTCSRPG